jgi:uncharacterized Rmd1/YagE family protein
MSYCSNCGYKREAYERVCPQCGFLFEQDDATLKKDERVKELEDKIASLEQYIRTSSNQTNQDSNRSLTWVMIVPIICFFAFMIIMVYIMVTF